MFNIKNIIVPTDLSKLSFVAFDYASSMAEQYNACIHLIYVLEKIPPFLTSRNSNILGEKMEESMEKQAVLSLNDATEDLRIKSGLNIVSALRKGTDYEEIIKYSSEVNADLIVLATHGRTGVLHTLLGSVAEKVIRYSKIPVLVTAPTEDNL